MAIETTEFADVSIAVSPTGVSSGNFGILGFLTLVSDSAINAITPAVRAKAYTSLKSVGVDWNATSETYLAATAFYAQTPTPKDFTVLMSYDVAQRATLIGGGHDTLAVLQAITSGDLEIVIDASTITLTTLDFSGASDLAAVAAIVQTAIAAVVAGSTCAYGAYGFVISGNTTGAAGTITHGVGDAASALGLAQDKGVISDGVDIEATTASLAAAVTKGIDFVGLELHKDLRDKTSQTTGNNTLDIANWAEAAKKIFMNTTNSLATLNSAITTDTPSQLKNATLRYSLSVFSKSINLYPGASIFGRAASVNFASIDSTITLNLKQMPGITVENLEPGEYATLKAKYCSSVVKIGSSVNAFADSRMASGSWLDTTHGLMWLENRIEVDMFNLMYQSTTKVKQTQTGINIAVEVLTGSLQAAVRNGLSAPGNLPDGTYLPEGFLIKAVKMKDVSSADKGARVYKGLSFQMVGAGALQEIIIAGNFAE